jgi:RHS repeat-associated protein
MTDSKSTSQRTTLQQQQPETLWQFLKLVLRGIRASYKRLVLTWAVQALVIMPLVMFLNTYIIAYLNEGVVKFDGVNNPTQNWHYFLRLGRNQSAADILCLLVFYVLSALYGRITAGGIKAFVLDLVGTPKWTSRSLSESGRWGLPILLVSAGLALVLTLFTRNKYIFIVVSVMLFMSYTTRDRNTSVFLAQLSWSDLQRVFRRHKARGNARAGPLSLTILGALAGALLLVFLPGQPYSALVLCTVFLVLAVLLVQRKIGAKPVIVLLGLLFVHALSSTMLRTVWAHDGGWSEGGGTLRTWLNSPGATALILSGARPGILGIVGALIGGIFGGLTNSILSVGGLTVGAIGPIAVGAQAHVPAGTIPLAAPPGAPQTPGGQVGANAPATSGVWAWNPALAGGPGDNPQIAHEGGQGPGRCGPGLPNYWVNTATLGLSIQDTIMAWEGHGPRIALKLSYNMGDRRTGVFGQGWRFAYESRVEHRGAEAHLWKGSGQRLVFRVGASNASASAPVEAIPEPGQHDRLLDYGAYWLYLPKAERLMYRYDKSPGSMLGYLTGIADMNGNVVQLRYASDGTLESLTDDAGRPVTVSYDAHRRCIGLSMADGRKAAFFYDASGRLIGARDLAEIPITYEYDVDGDVVRMVVGHDRKVTTFSYAHTGPKRIRSVTDAAGNTRRYEAVATDSSRTRMVDPESNVTVYQTMQGRTTEIVDPLGQALRYTFEDGDLTATQDRNGAKRHFAYDWRGNLVRSTDRLGNATTYAYDNYDRLTSKTDPLGATWRYAYDAKGNVVAITAPSGAATHMEYDPLGQVVGVTDGNGRLTRFAYDRFGNMAALTDADSQTSRLEYDAHGFHLVAITGANGHATRYAYDGNGRLLTVTHPDGCTSEHVYDCCVRIATTDENGRQTVFARNALSSILARNDGEGHSVRFDYDGNDNPVAMHDPLGRTMRWHYDAAGRPMDLVDALGATLRMARDGEGRLVELTNALGHRTQLAYDDAGHLMRSIDPGGRGTSWRYDPVGRPLERCNARGQRIGVEYAPNGLIANRAHDGVTQTAVEYDAVGNPTVIKDAHGETSYSYDACNRLSHIRYRVGVQIRFEYDAAGNLSRLEYPNGLCVQYAYDARNRLTRIAWGRQEIVLERDGVGNVTGERRSNGVHSRYRYDANDQIVEIEHGLRTKAYAQLVYRRDAAGNIVAASGAWLVAPQLTALSHQTSYNELDQIEVSDGARYLYDKDGNLVEIDGGLWRAEYDAENHLIECARAGEITRYSYDGLGRCVARSRVDEMRAFYRDLSGRLLCEGDGEGAMSACYVYAGPLLVARITAAGDTQFYHFDQTGNTLAITDPEGQVAAAYAYGPYGEPMGQRGDVKDNPFTYVGEYGVMDQGDGLYLMGTRFYDGHAGRFLQRDTLGLAGGLNLYTYAANNPIMGVDPDGTFLIEFAALLTVAVVMIAGAKIGKDMQNGTINRGLAAAAARSKNPDKVTVKDVQDVLGPNPGQQAVREIFGAVGEGGVAIITNAPTPFAPGAKAVKAIIHATRGEGTNAVKEGIGLVPGPVGEIGDALQNMHTIVTEGPSAMPDCAPPKGR